MLYAEIIGLVQLWLWPCNGLGLALGNTALALRNGALALEPVALLTALLLTGLNVEQLR